MGHKMPERSVIWRYGFYDWVFSNLSLRLFAIVICQVSVAGTIMYRLIYLSQNLIILNRYWALF